MVADAMECAEGVSFLGVRRLLLVDVPIGAVDYMQRIGRAVRFMGHASLPEAERRVEVLMYVAAGSEKGVTADEVLVNRLRKASSDYKTELAKLRAVAVDAGTWADEEAASSADAAAADDDEAAAGAAPAAADASGFATDEASASESEDDDRSRLRRRRRRRARRRSCRAAANARGPAHRAADRADGRPAGSGGDRAHPRRDVAAPRVPVPARASRRWSACRGWATTAGSAPRRRARPREGEEEDLPAHPPRQVRARLGRSRVQGAECDL